MPSVMSQPSTVSHSDIETNSESALQFNTQYRAILLAVDSSDHSNRATEDGIKLGKLYQAGMTASHVYAAQMHDMRFKQMEGGLPEQFKEENELERQRDIHDSLITRGLSIITDSYLIQAQTACEQYQLKFSGRSLEGKNYRVLVNEANNGQYDLLVMGALGLGAIPGSTIGTVCERATRRCAIDSLIIKQPQHSISDGPLVAAIDGSKQSYAALLTAFNLARAWQTPLHVVSAFDPDYHYVAFNRIANVLSDEAGQVFRFKEQEQLHEEIIDDGLAKIYQGHLDVAQQLAEDFAINIETHLLTGKPHHAIEQYLRKISASLLLMGKTGIHCDDELDIGGNTENLLRNSPCALLLTQRQYTPEIELLAETTTSWTTQAEQAMQHIPPFVQNMARAAILRYAQTEGHTVITADIVQEATRNMCPAGMKNLDNLVDAASQAKKARQVTAGAFDMDWSEAAEQLLQQVNDPTLRHNTKMRAEKRALTEKSTLVSNEHILPFIVNPQLKQQTNNINKNNKKNDNENSDQPVSRCPFSSMDSLSTQITLPWDEDALQKLHGINDELRREMLRKASNVTAHKQNLTHITVEFLEQFLEIFDNISQQMKH